MEMTKERVHDFEYRNYLKNREKKKTNVTSEIWGTILCIIV
jgi:hypothetical protein